MNLNLAVSFLAGLATFFSPCILPIIPGYILVLSSGQSGKIVRRVLLFALGLALTFVVLGLLIGWVGADLASYRETLLKVIGILLIILGFNLLRPLPIPLLQGDWQMRWKLPPSDYSALLFGAAFGIAWTPCTGVVLAAILSQAVILQSQAVPLLAAYALGLVIPMIGIAMIFQRTGKTLKLPGWMERNYAPVLGIIIILLGLMILTGAIDNLRNWLFTVTPTSGLCLPLPTH